MKLGFLGANFRVKKMVIRHGEQAMVQWAYRKLKVRAAEFATHNCGNLNHCVFYICSTVQISFCARNLSQTWR
jgi:hypothetical protein